MRRQLWIPAFLAVMLAACAAATTGGGGGDVITAEELEEVQARTAYEAIQQLRPFFLRGRAMSPTGDSDPVQVYVDGVHMGDVEYLRQISVSEIQEIRHLDANTAAVRFGTGHTNGAILVSTRT